MRKFLQTIRQALKTPYDPDLGRRAEVTRFLSHRPSFTSEAWHQRFAASHGIPLSFVAWFRDACSKYFEFDLSAALPEDRLVEDLGLFSATWGDADWDILEDYEGRFGCKRPPLENVFTFGQLLQTLWSHIPKSDDT